MARNTGPSAPVLISSNRLSTLHRRLACVLQPCLTGSCPDFSGTFTTARASS